MLHSLQEDKNIVILKADKGNATVILDFATYQQKIKHLLTDTSYCTIKKDLTGRVDRGLCKLLKSSGWVAEIKNVLKIKFWTSTLSLQSTPNPQNRLPHAPSSENHRLSHV